MTPEEKSQQRREECRRDVRKFLVGRQALAFQPATIRRKLNIEHDFDLDEIREALAFLVGLNPPHATVLPDPDGATPYYQATSAAVLAAERRGI